MKRDLSKAFGLIRFGISMNKAMNIGCMVVFLIIGLVGEAYCVFTGNNILISQIDFWVFLVGAAFSFPAQFLLTTDVALAVQTSAYKKKIQTTMFMEVSLIMSLISATIFVIIRAIGAVIHPENATRLWGELPMIGAIICLILLFVVGMYKYYWISLILLYLVIFGLSGTVTFLSLMEGYDVLVLRLPPALDVIICYALIFIGCGIAYLLSLAFYRKPFSKVAFGAAMSKYVQ